MLILNASHFISDVSTWCPDPHPNFNWRAGVYKRRRDQEVYGLFFHRHNEKTTHKLPALVMHARQQSSGATAHEEQQKHVVASSCKHCEVASLQLAG